eukprot:758638-Hanusia_phi.AAC.2
MIEEKGGDVKGSSRGGEQRSEFFSQPCKLSLNSVRQLNLSSTLCSCNDDPKDVVDFSGCGHKR